MLNIYMYAYMYLCVWRILPSLHEDTIHSEKNLYTE